MEEEIVVETDTPNPSLDGYEPFDEGGAGKTKITITRGDASKPSA